MKIVDVKPQGINPQDTQVVKTKSMKQIINDKMISGIGLFLFFLISSIFIMGFFRQSNAYKIYDFVLPMIIQITAIGIGIYSIILKYRILFVSAWSATYCIIAQAFLYFNNGFYSKDFFIGNPWTKYPVSEILSLVFQVMAIAFVFYLVSFLRFFARYRDVK